MVRMVWWNSYGSIRFFDCNKPRKLKTVSDSLMFRLRPHGSPKTQLSCLRSAASPFSIASTAKLDFQPLADRRSPFIQGMNPRDPGVDPQSHFLSRTVQYHFLRSCMVSVCLDMPVVLVQVDRRMVLSKTIKSMVKENATNWPRVLVQRVANCSCIHYLFLVDQFEFPVYTWK